MQIQVVNWAGYNPRADLKHTNWFRIESDIAMSRKLFGLDAEQRWFWIYLLSLAASQNKGGIIDAEMGYLSHFSMVTESKCQVALDRIEACGLITMSGTRPSVSGIRPEMATTDGTNETNGTNITGPVTEPATPVIKKRATYQFEECDLISSTWFRDEIKARNPYARKIDNANMEAWANELRLLRDKGITDSQIRGLMQWVLESEFWRPNVQSTGKLRDKWDQLTAAVIAETRIKEQRALAQGQGFKGGHQ